MTWGPALAGPGRLKAASTCRACPSVSDAGRRVTALGWTVGEHDGAVLDRVDQRRCDVETHGRAAEASAESSECLRHAFIDIAGAVHDDGAIVGVIVDTLLETAL